MQASPLSQHRRAHRIAALAIAALSVVPTVSGAALLPESWVRSPNSLLPLDLTAQRGPLAAGEPVHVVLALKPHDAAALDSFVEEVSRPGSPAYGQSLSSEQFLERFAPSAAEAQAVADHLTQAGFRHVSIAPNHLLVTADGSAATALTAFRTPLARFERDGVSGFANTAEVQLPAKLASRVQSVLGLQNVDHLHTQLVHASLNRAGAAPQATPAAKGLSPLAFPAAYGVGSTPTASQTAIGIVSEGDLTQTITDLRTFESQNGLPQQAVNIVRVGAAGTDTSGTDEWDLDSQDIQAMSGGVKSMVFYDTTSLSNADITAAYNQAVTDKLAKIINVSLGECETSAQSDGTISADDTIFKAAIAQGQIFSVSSGDSGSHECSVLIKTKNNAKQSYPASSPYVVSVGGTSLYVNSNGSYYSESAWSGSGGGPSTIEAKPSFQNVVVTGTKRGVPDVALDADPNTGAIVIVSGSAEQIGGTSLASPLFVGLYARIETANNNALGFPLASFYQYFPSHSTLIHDVTTGNNGGSNTYNAGTGWDFVTGFGSPIVAALSSFIASTPGF